MKRLLPFCLILVLLLTGCSTWLDGSYSSVTPHKADTTPVDIGDAAVSNYLELYVALRRMVESVTVSGMLQVPDYDEQLLPGDMDRALRTLRRENPYAVYALEEAEWELGTTGGKRVVAVTMTYSKAKAEVLRIRSVDGEQDCMDHIADALEQCDDRLVLHIKRYTGSDFVQMVEDYAMENPHIVMEIPKTTAISYPENGTERIVELTFTYENSRDRLRHMRSQVTPVFRAAVLNVSGDAEAPEKFELLYSFLMERHNYTVNTSITPAYSLIRHGEGDAKAFATVYAAMCRAAELQCVVITGTRDGEAWYWNLLYDGENWHHLDLLRCNQGGEGFRWYTDAEMTGYVWDYAQYPASVLQPLPTPAVPMETTAPTATTVPPETAAQAE